MFLKNLFSTPLQKIMAKKLHCFNGWTNEYHKSDGEETFTLRKDELTIIFIEDRREHIINFKILHPQKRMVNVEFREVKYMDKSLDMENLKLELDNLIGPNEKAEVDIFIRFLSINKII